MQWIEAAEYRAPSMTTVTTQRSLGVRLPPGWKPGISSYGLAVSGRVLRDLAGNPVGIRFSTVYSWPGDRRQASDGPPMRRQSREVPFDTEEHTLQICGDAVVLTVSSRRRSIGFRATTKNLDVDGRQLIFFVPGPDPESGESRLALALGGCEWSPRGSAVGENTVDPCWSGSDRLSA